MLIAVLSWLVALGCIARAVLLLGRINAAAPARFFGLSGRQRPKTRADWSEAPVDRVLHARAYDLVHAVVGTEPRVAAVARLNEQLADIDAELRQSQGEGPVLARISLISGAFLGILGVARGLPEPGWSPAPALLALLAGMVGAVAVWQIDRLAGARARRIRAEWDEWAHALERVLPAERAAGPMAEGNRADEEQG